MEAADEESLATLTTHVLSAPYRRDVSENAVLLASEEWAAARGLPVLAVGASARLRAGASSARPSKKPVFLGGSFGGGASGAPPSTVAPPPLMPGAAAASGAAKHLCAAERTFHSI